MGVFNHFLNLKQYNKLFICSPNIDILFILQISLTYSVLATLIIRGWGDKSPCQFIVQWGWQKSLHNRSCNFGWHILSIELLQKWNQMLGRVKSFVATVIDRTSSKSLWHANASKPYWDWSHSRAWLQGHHGGQKDQKAKRGREVGEKIEQLDWGFRTMDVPLISSCRFCGTFQEPSLLILHYLANLNFFLCHSKSRNSPDNSYLLKTKFIQHSLTFDF